MTKKCFKCGQKKTITEFYKGQAMADGHLNKCIECTKRDVQKYSQNLKKMCVICGKEFGTCITQIKKGGGLTCSRDCFYQRLRQITPKGSEHPNWKGDEVGNGALHDWVRSELGRPRYCENCKTTKAKKFEWANISGLYKRNVKDWKRLCTKCHHKFDKTTEKWRKIMHEKHGWKTK